MQSNLKRLGKTAAVYGLGGALAKGIPFLLLPIYTRLFEPGTFGRIELFTVIGLLAETFICMGLDSALSFFFFKQEALGIQAQAKVVSAIFQWRATVGLLIALLGIASFPYWPADMVTASLTYECIVLFFFGVWLTQFKAHSAEIFRLTFRPFWFVTIEVTQAVVTAGVTLTLAYKTGGSIRAFFWGYFAGAAVAATLGWIQARNYLDLRRWHVAEWPRLLRFGLPLMPSAIGLYFLSTSDRWLVSHFMGPSAVGLYAVGAKFALMIGLVVATFRQAWWPMAMESLQSPEGPVLIRQLAKLYLGVGTVGTLVIAGLAPTLVHFFAAPEYFNAWKIVGVLVWNSVLYGFFSIGGIGIWKMERTEFTTLTLAMAVFVAVSGQWWLIPKMGLLGAAIPTAFAFLVWNVVALALSEKLWPIGFPLGILVAQLTLGLAGCGTIGWLHSTGQPLYAGGVALVASSLVIWLTLAGKHHTKEFSLP